MSTTAGTGAAADKLPPTIGRYRVVERIGTGAMGMVYAADDDTLGRRVAVKVMMGDLEDEPEMRGRFSARRRSPDSSPTATSSPCSISARRITIPTS